jgi:chorismate mutase/prephenate dehydratase
MKDIDIKKMRERLAQLDRNLIKQLNQRAQFTTLLKSEPYSCAFLSRQGDQALFEEIKSENQGPLSNPALKNILREIESACEQVQGERRIAFLGPDASFCHLAAQSHFGKSADFAAKGSIADVFREVERGKAIFGVVPVENSLEGSMAVTLDMLTKTNLQIMGEVLMNVSYCLVSKETDLDRVRRVVSHAVALEKCAAWLGRNLPSATCEDATSSAAAAALAAKEPGTAALASKASAGLHGLAILAEDVQEANENITRFIIIGPHLFPETGNDKTSLLFVTRHHPGALADALGILAKHDVNLTKIESRPTKEAGWNYQFFADLEGHVNDQPMSEALAELAREVSHLKVLGSYAKG